jgi:hypothetical protein
VSNGATICGHRSCRGKATMLPSKGSGSARASDGAVSGRPTMVPAVSGPLYAVGLVEAASRVRQLSVFTWVIEFPFFRWLQKKTYTLVVVRDFDHAVPSNMIRRQGRPRIFSLRSSGERSALFSCICMQGSRACNCN